MSPISLKIENAWDILRWRADSDLAAIRTSVNYFDEQLDFGRASLQCTSAPMFNDPFRSLL